MRPRFISIISLQSRNLSPTDNTHNMAPKLPLAMFCSQSRAHRNAGAEYQAQSSQANGTIHAFILPHMARQHGCAVT
jgi:hypothetical protein